MSIAATPRPGTRSCLWREGLIVIPYEHNGRHALDVEHCLRPEGTTPCRRIEMYREHARERFLSPRELYRLGRALRVAERCGAITPWTAGAIRLLVFTGARLSEILTARWEWVNQAEGALELPDSKTGRKVIRLSPPALKTLAALPRLDGNPFIICARSPARISSTSKAVETRPQSGVASRCAPGRP